MFIKKYINYLLYGIISHYIHKLVIKKIIYHLLYD